MTQALHHPEIFDRLRLIRSNNIGPVSYVQLIKRFGSAAAALEAIPQLASRGGAKAPRIADADRTAREIDKVAAMGGNFLFLDDPDYPIPLTQLSNPPAVLTWRGKLALLQLAAVAIVGARNASAAACRFTRDMAFALAQARVAIVSGLARGIDTAAHEGAVGRATIGVIAGGIDVHYPPENKMLQEQIAEQGLLLAEQPWHTQPRARHFPYRNRIIAGLASGTVVMEAAPRSGSLITARLAAENGRQVMAIPGSPLDPRSRGCNMLIREGAVLVQSAEDVLEMIQHFDDRAAHIAPRGDLFDDEFRAVDPRETDAANVDDNARNKLHGLLCVTPVATDELVRQAGLSPATVQLILLELELAGRLTRHAGARVSLAS